MTARKPLRGRSLAERVPFVEASLWRRLRFEGEARCRERLFSRFLTLARALAHREFGRRPPQGLERGDFEQWAYGGLLEAIDAYDPLRGALFSAFARHRIRGSIADGAALASEASAQYTFRRRIEQERLGSVSAQETRASADPVRELGDLATSLALGLMIEALPDASNSPQGYESPAWRDLQITLAREIERLPDSEGAIIRHHYQGGVSFTQIARLLGLTKGRVSQLHRAALERIRVALTLND